MQRSPRRAAALTAMALLAGACEGGGGTASVSGGDAPAAEADGSAATVAGGLPPTDFDMATVPLEQVFFDTFDGGSVPLDEASSELIESLRDRIPPIEDPVYVGGSAPESDWLAPDDLVLGHVDNDGTARAFPHRILNFHEIVNDTFAGEPVLVSYCPLCASGVVFDRRLDGQLLTFGNTSALYENDLVMYDHQTNSYWWQVAGRAIIGQLAGQELQARPSETSTWQQWQSRYPDTLVLARPEGREQQYERDPFVGYQDRVDAGQFPFPVGEGSKDPRLSAGTRVLGIQVDGQAVAYPLEALAGRRIEHEVAGTDVVVELADDAAGGRAWQRTRAGELEPLGTRTSFWFAFVGAFPDAQVFTAH